VEKEKGSACASHANEENSRIKHDEKQDAEPVGRTEERGKRYERGGEGDVRAQHFFSALSHPAAELCPF